MHGGLNGIRVSSQHGVVDLTKPGQLRFDEPVGAGADVALDAFDLAVGRLFVHRKFWTHDFVAQCSAKRDRLRVVERLVGPDDGHEEHDGRARNEDHDHVAVRGGA